MSDTTVVEDTVVVNSGAGPDDTGGHPCHASRGRMARIANDSLVRGSIRELGGKAPRTPFERIIFVIRARVAEEPKLSMADLSVKCFGDGEKDGLYRKGRGQLGVHLKRMHEVGGAADSIQLGILRRIATGLGASLPWILHGLGDPFPDPYPARARALARLGDLIDPKARARLRELVDQTGTMSEVAWCLEAAKVQMAIAGEETGAGDSSVRRRIGA